MTLDPKLQAPRVPLQWFTAAESAADIAQTVDSTISKDRSVLDRVAALSPSECTFDNVFRAIALSDAENENQTGPLTFYQYIAPVTELRDGGNAAEQKLNEYGIEASMRLDVFKSLQAANENIKKQGVKLSFEEQRLVDKMLLDGKRNGLDLPDETREKVKELKKDLSNTCTEFSKNFNEEKGTIQFTKEELQGVPEDVISGYKTTEDGKYIVTFKTPDIVPIMKHARNPETRRKTLEGSESKLEINVPLFEKAIRLRKQLADLQSYHTWADYVEEVKMIKTGTAVKDFLDALQKKLTPIGNREKSEFLKLKKEEHEKYGYPASDELYLWDYRYYDNAYVEKSLDLDDNLVKEYFPVDVVVPAILEIYQELLGVQFRDVTGKTSTWHQEVRHFEVWEKGASKDTDFLGDLYLDLYPRENKYSHAAVWGMIQSYIKEDGSLHYPVACMVANLAKPTPDRPALMRHDDAVTFMHEMGHAFHGILSRVQFGRFHGTNVARDFVEAPSQMLENWCWEPVVLKRITSHYKTQEKLSDELIKKLVQSRFVNSGLFNLRQLFFGIFDITVHTDKRKDGIDFTKLWCDLREKVSLVKTGSKLTPGQGSFGHLMGGYDAGYYGYLYSQVFSADMYATIFAKDPMSHEAGQRYRKEILIPGGSRDEADSLKKFLGREPNSDAFLKTLLGSSEDAQEKSTANL